ncbi:MAG: SDR family NAD(P)-dependent oxidoreductase, partial [Ruminococcaceae bacterium]|nr:SDR family NAD(P)-dependent oxidoreductase [Oscillospiraceae bacterium]
MNKTFENKIAVVTGAGGTLCSEIAIQLSLEGVRVFLVGRTEEKLQKTAEKITALGGTPATIFVCDVTDQKSVAKLAETVEAAGGCDYLINGAGGNNVKAMPTITKYDPRELSGELPEGQKGLYDIDMDAFKSVLEINTMGTVIPTMELSKQMIKK